jgi:hypothetical protein
VIVHQVVPVVSTTGGYLEGGDDRLSVSMVAMLVKIGTAMSSKKLGKEG